MQSFIIRSAWTGIDKLHRALIAMQTADAFSISTPEDWRRGDDVIVPRAGSCCVAKNRMEGKEVMKSYEGLNLAYGWTGWGI